MPLRENSDLSESDKGRAYPGYLRIHEIFAPALLLGLALAVFLAQLDFVSRVVEATQIWSEFYQDILVGVLLCEPLFLALGGLVLLLQKTGRRRITIKVFRRILFLVAGLVLFCSALSILLANIELSLLQGRTSFQQLLVFALTPLLTALLTFCLFELSSLETSWLKRIVSRYVLIFGILSAVLMLIDALQYSSISSGINEKPITQQSVKYPNIVILTLDGMRPERLFDNASNLKLSARGQNFSRTSIFFHDAQSPSSCTANAHASILGARYFFGDHLDKASAFSRWPSLTQILSEQGYDTAAFVGGDCCKRGTGIESGFSLFDDRLDFIEFESFHPLAVLRRVGTKFIPAQIRRLLGNDRSRSSEQLNSAVFRWLEEKSRFTRPFFLYLQYNDLLNFAGQKLEASLESDPEHRQLLEREYFQNSQLLVEAARDLTEQLDLLGFLENTVLVVTSAHGFELFEHGRFGLSQSLHQELLHVPLLISYPQRPEEQYFHQLCGLVDIAPTLIDLLELSADLDFDGKSLMPLARGLQESAHPLLVAQTCSEHESGRALITADWKLMVSDSGGDGQRKALFHRKDDREELTDLASSEIQVLEKLSWTLEKVLDQ